MLLLMTIGPDTPENRCRKRIGQDPVSPEIEFATRARKVPAPESLKLVTDERATEWKAWSNPFTRRHRWLQRRGKW